MDPTTLSILAIVIPSVIAVAAIIVSVVLYLKQKSKKELSYEIVSDASVVSVASKVSSKVQILFEGKLVEKTVRLVVVSLRNSGNQPVNREDFDDNKPIVFQFDTSKTKILDAEIVEPNLVGASLEKDPTLLAEGRLGLLPVLINQKEQVQFSVLLEGEEVFPQVSVRISGGNIKPFKPRTNKSNFGYGWLDLFFGLFLVVSVFILVARSFTLIPLIYLASSYLFFLLITPLVSITAVPYFLVRIHTSFFKE